MIALRRRAVPMGRGAVSRLSMMATLRTEWRQYRAPSTATSSTCLSFAQPVRHAISVALDTTDDVRPGGSTSPRWDAA
ncbi:hypothetical protein DMB42_38755 [Nonomuraea sp. WAC 01424]|nr:hypothetical protein DMB42_38755 [Nonomuraea sp. WAC 01424]